MHVLCDCLACFAIIIACFAHLTLQNGSSGTRASFSIISEGRQLDTADYASQQSAYDNNEGWRLTVPAARLNLYDATGSIGVQVGKV